MATEIDYMEYATDEAAQAAYPTNGTTYGMSIASRASGISAGRTAIISSGSGATISGAGTIRSFSYYTSSAGVSIKLIVLRINGSNYDLVGASEAFSSVSGGTTRTLTNPVTGVQSGDLIGIYSAGVLNNIWGTDAGYVAKYYTSEVTGTTAMASWGTTDPGSLSIAVVVDHIDVYSESTIKTQGSYSIKAIATTDALNDTLTRTIGSPIDLSGVDTLRLDIRASRTGSNIKIGIHDSGGTTTETTPNVTDANTWQTVVWDISAVDDADKDDIDSIIITIANADSANTFYLDRFCSAEDVTITAEPFIVTTSLSSVGGMEIAGYGYVYEQDTTGAVMDVAVRTKAKVGRNVLKRKNLKYIYHMMNTHGKDITMTIYVDGEAQTPTFTVNTTERKMVRIEDVPNFEGYKFDIRLTGEDLTDNDLEIYGHLALQHTVYGE